MRTIALIEIGNDGHREAYMRYFIGGLLELDCRVICMIPETSAVKNWVDVNYPEKKENVIYQAIEYFRNKFSYAGRLRERLNLLYNWRYTGLNIQTVEKKSGWKTDLVFFNFLDAYLVNYTPTFIIDSLIGKKWSGIYFFPAFLRLQPALLNEAPKLSSRDNILTAKNCIAAGFHDEGILEKFSGRIHKKVLLFPEIADLSDPDLQDEFYRQIKLQSNGRIVIGNIGLEKHKGNYALQRLAKIASPEKYFFVFTGRDDGTLFDFLTAEQAGELKTFIANLPANCTWKPAFLSEGPQYNAILSSFDIVYCIYTHFYGASNRLTKAAHFRKLILADDKYCIGDAVKKYDLGEAVPDTEPQTMLGAADRLRERIINQDLPEKNWKEFLSEHNYSALKQRFKELLDLL